MQYLSIVSVLLLSSSLSKTFALFFINIFSLNLYSNSIAVELLSNNPVLATEQTFDVVELVLFGVISVAIFGLNNIVIKETPRVPVVTTYLLTSTVIFLQAHFVVHSRLILLMQVLLLQVVYLMVSRSKRDFKSIDITQMMNGLFLGFYMFLVSRFITTSFAIQISSLFVFPVIFAYAKPWRLLRHPSYLVFIFATIYPFSKVALILLAALFVALLSIEQTNKYWFSLYLPAIIYLVVFNPLFYVGTFDSLEEGFWLGWAQRLLSGEVMYKDFYAYHPPFIVWGLITFLRSTSESIYSFRLYIHLLQIAGVLGIYGLLRTLVKSKLLQIATMVILLSFLTRDLTNNVEIRLGLGLLSVTSYISFIKKHSVKYLILSGVFAGIALFTSIEIGLVVIASLIFTLPFVSQYSDRSLLRLYYYVAIGFFTVTIPTIIVLVTQSAFVPFVNQMVYVLKLFGNGYSGASIARPTTENLILIREVKAYLTSPWMYWQIARAGSVGALLLVIHQRFTNRLENTSIAAFVTSVFGLLLFRTALGRSDEYHIITVLIPALILIAYSIEKVVMNRVVGVCILVIGMLVVGQNKLFAYINNNFEKFQSYGTPAGQYPSYEFERYGILTLPGEDTRREELLVNYIKNNTSYTDRLYVFPQKPELYFLTERMNATSFDTPIIYLFEEYQIKMIEELEKSKPPIIVYSPTIAFYEISAKSLKLVDRYINESYVQTKVFGEWQILERI